jgi:hypothetical protein
LELGTISPVELWMSQGGEIHELHKKTHYRWRSGRWNRRS